MEKMIESIVSDLKEIYREAYIQYKPVVERVCSRKASESEVENILENLVIFCSSYDFLKMYKRICSYYIYDYTTMISYYVYLYRDMYELDDSEAIENMLCIGLLIPHHTYKFITGGKLMNSNNGCFDI